uniref:Uncharacterized protein n=1 Tax=Plectus sambesii TaxID=2011161 RepID=A0A914WQC0_9BILA
MAPPQELSTINSTSEPEPMLVLRNCPASACDIELKFQSLTDREFMIQVEAPNGEKSLMLHFPGAGCMRRFNPSKTGCGHGEWEIEVFAREEDGNYHKILTEELMADGTGSLFFTVGEDLQPVLESQVWAHLPKNASCRKYSFFSGDKRK